MPTGYMGKILRVNLSTGELKDEPLPDESVLRKYVGGKGLALWYLMRETTPEMKAGDPEVPLIFMTGPLAGTTAPSSSDYCVASLHFSVPYAAGTGHSHGFFAAYMRFAGYDGIIITGASEEPVYLHIDDGKPELRSADKVWGKGTRETNRLLTEELGSPGRLSIASIGPFGEAMLHGGSIGNDANHSAHKGSPGAVMGSKKLKALAVHGNATVTLADPDTFNEAVGVWTERQPATVAGMAKGGILNGYASGQGSRAMFKNLTDPGQGQPLHDSFARDLPQWVVEPQPSFNCTIACAYNAKITTGPCAGFTAQLDGGGENLEPAALLGVEDAGTVLMLADYWDDMGIDASIPAAVIAALMEMYEKGVISSEDIDGIDLTWGNFEAVMEIVDKMIAREGIGAKLATKMTDAVRAIHPDGGKFLVHVKGGGMNLHDWRGAWNILFSDIVAGAGPSWQGLGVGEKELIGEAGTTAPFDPDGKAAAVKATQPKKVWEDSLGVCWFAMWGVEDSLNLTSKALGAATGWSDFSADEALEVGDRITNLMRLMYAKRGFKKEDEFDVSSKLTGGLLGNPESAMEPHVRKMVDEYYELMGWDVATGHPKPETISKLGLEEFADGAGVPA